jgi:hypothetical protein
MMNLLSLALIFSTLAGSAPTPSKFDLICSGEELKIENGIQNTSPWKRHFRVDLDEKLYCVGSCTFSIEISEVTASTIKLRNYSSLSVTNIERIDRLTGEFYGASLDQDVETRQSVQRDIRAKCEAAPFSTLPMRKF